MGRKDVIKINAENSYGDVFSTRLSNPSRKEVIQSTISILLLVGFSKADIYFALEEEAEILKQQILTK